MKYTVILEKGRESGFVATAPALRGCVSQGATREEAIANVKEAIEVFEGELISVKVLGKATREPEDRQSKEEEL